MIAAGEVVERPASVVKELVENCVDAGATSITVEIKKGGITYIRVTDNGGGIPADEIETAFVRHATSKIRYASDLDGICTLGFRGEALASIAAVARVEIFSKVPECEIGRCVVNEAGQIMENDEAGCANGTTVIVRNLFFNTPARMKFLKSDSAETAYVTDVVSKLILSHPEISIQYINNGKKILGSNGNGNLNDCIYTVYGRDYSHNMIDVNYSDSGMSVTGCIGNQFLSRKDRRHQIFFINSRNITCKVMNAAVGEAFRNSTMVGRFPVCVLKVQLDPKLVDVNVHPTKMEVRFSDDKKIYDLVYWGVKNALVSKKTIPEVNFTDIGNGGNKSAYPIKNIPDFDSAKQMELRDTVSTYVQSGTEGQKKIVDNRAAADKTDNRTVDLLMDVSVQNTDKPAEMPNSGGAFLQQDNSEVGEETDTSRFNYANVRKHNVVNDKVIQSPGENESPVIPQTEKTSVEPNTDFLLVGQVFGTYIIIQQNDHMIMIDQHAAHERLCFEALLEEFKSAAVTSQLLMIPVTVTLNAEEMECAEENKEFFEKLGFEIDRFTENSIAVRSTPSVLSESLIRDSVSEIITAILKNQNSAVLPMYIEALETIACKSALKGNHNMNEKEMQTLVQRILELGDGINTCPHGRPIMIDISKYQLDKRFKRIV